MLASLHCVVQDYFQNGATPFVKLVAMPLDATESGWSLVTEEKLTDQHGLTGYVPCAEVLDWRVVVFDEEYQGNWDLLPDGGVFQKVIQGMWEAFDLE